MTMHLLTVNDPPAQHPDPDLQLPHPALTLVPLRIEHAEVFQPYADQREEGLYAGLASPMDFDGSASQFVSWLLERRGKGICPYAVEDAAGRVVGYTRYLHVEPRSRTLHIGGTWYIPEARGTVINPAAKFTLLRHAFEDLGYNRVQIQTDVRNTRSQRAIIRIGAQFEGVSRADYLRRDGTVRDTWIGSIIRTEWPGVSARLEQLVAEAQPVHA